MRSLHEKLATTEMARSHASLRNMIAAWMPSLASSARRARHREYRRQCHSINNRLCFVVFLLLLSGCGGGLYIAESFEPASLDVRAVEQTKQGVRVKAAVPGADETQAIFGLPLYEQGIQPIWLEVTNSTGRKLRYAPVGTDPEYFSALEVAYMNRSGYSQEALRAMEEQMLELAMPRDIEVGDTASGFVLTHLQPGTKGFNVDLFGDEFGVRFSFFLDVLGFVPDHSEVELEQLYAAEDLVQIAAVDLYEYLRRAPHAAKDAAGNEAGSPINVVLIGQAHDLLYASLRAGWHEVAAPATTTAGPSDYFLFGRVQDTTFRHEGGANDGSYELRIWLSPATTDDVPIWLGQLKHVIDHRWIDATPDPDTEGALFFLLQNLWYGESLMKHGWILLGAASGGEEYFATNLRGVLWISADPVELDAVDTVDWDYPEVE